ncbi:ninjurin-1 [Ceratitis capitata]|uniref:(Mediterranean fruit fly) hypothetical protein n=1 Tax=Ceratitis capitata TaxID=7213 RepID=W8C1D1_CERCA|nr:ninjurin-1 [Ceratitis capitata]CAD7005132.1 unnamed protein product [Ceratitis capitata]
MDVTEPATIIQTTLDTANSKTSGIGEHVEQQVEATVGVIDNGGDRTNEDITNNFIEYDIEHELREKSEHPSVVELHRMNSLNYAGNKNMVQGLMDIALLSANANQLRFLLTYNNKAPTYYMSLGLVSMSLVLQVVVGLALIYKRHLKKTDPRYEYTKELLIFGVFIITVVNVLLAAFTTTDND